MADTREMLALVVCNATQKTNYKCEFDCEKKGKCAYCLIMAEQMIANGVTVTDNNVGGKLSPTGCDYCQEDREGYRRALGSFFLANPFHGSLWQIKTKRTKPRQIFFCPMCGRKLAEPPKGE